MSKIVISGYYGFANAGDEAMLTAIVKSLRKTEASVDLTVISGNPQSTATKHLVNSVHRFSPLEIYSAVANCDLLISGGGSLLQSLLPDHFGRGEMAGAAAALPCPSYFAGTDRTDDPWPLGISEGQRPWGGAWPCAASLLFEHPCKSHRAA